MSNKDYFRSNSLFLTKNQIKKKVFLVIFCKNSKKIQKIDIFTLNFFIFFNAFLIIFASFCYFFNKFDVNLQEKIKIFAVWLFFSQFLYKKLKFCHFSSIFVNFHQNLFVLYFIFAQINVKTTQNWYKLIFK